MMAMDLIFIVKDVMFMLILQTKISKVGVVILFNCCAIIVIW